MKPELFDAIELIIDLPEENLQAGMQGAIVEEYSDAYEVEFCNSDGETIALLALKPEQFIVVWKAATQSWLPVSERVAAVITHLPDDRRQQVLEFARSLVAKDR